MNNLLEKYFNGTSSSEEEKKLSDYFNGDAVLPEHKIYEPIFSHFNREKEIKAPIIAFPETKKMRTLNRRAVFLTIAGTAAVVLLAVTLSVFYRTHQPEPEYIVIVNGKQIYNQHSAKQYADNMLTEADKIVDKTYQPFREASELKSELSAEKISREAAQQIKLMKTKYEQ